MNRSLPARLLAVVAMAAALTLAPNAAFADNFPGTNGDDNITGTPGDDSISGDPGPVTIVGGDDTINGGGGDDEISGDGYATLVGGDDTINGGDGDDEITGDGVLTGVGGDDTINGGDGDDLIAGDGSIVGVGGDDTINGGDGDDEIYGDGYLFELIGGDDVIHGGAGNDLIYGGRGDDLLCGDAGFDVLYGEEGVDLACAVDDHITVGAGLPGMLDLAANDDQLDDEGYQDLAPLRYRIVGHSASIIDPILDAITGILTFTATSSGTVDYEVYRTLDGRDLIASLATVFINVPEDEPKKDSDAAPAETALLPDTGASDTRVLGPLALASILGGIALLLIGRRRPVVS